MARHTERRLFHAARVLAAAGLALAATGCARDAGLASLPEKEPPPAERNEPARPAPTPTREAPAPAPTATTEREAPAWVELAPGLRVDRVRRIVEFDGFVPWEFKDPEQPVTYLEAIVCKVDSKEHESLVATRVRPSLVHGALLSIGLEPGRPGRIGFDEDGSFVREGATGPQVEVVIVTTWPDGVEREVNPLDWVVQVEDGARFDRGASWHFAGSIERQRAGRAAYEADVEGVIVGLHTFGSEVVGLSAALSPDSGVDEPEWIADVGAVPAFGEPVRVRIRAVD